MGFSSPPLPRPPEDCAFVRVEKTAVGNVRGPSGVKSWGPELTVTPGPWATRKRSKAKTAPCVIREAPWARAGLSDLSNFRRWMGAPLAEDGLKCEGIRSWPRFSRTLLSQDSVVGSLSEMRRNGSCTRRPPSPPHGSARHDLEAGTSRLVRSLQLDFGCPQ